MMKYKNQLYPHKYPPLISKFLFDKCQEVMAGYHKKPFKYLSKPFIFRGLIKCADCGCTITPEMHKGHIYYSCTNFRKIHGRKTYVKEEELLKPIYEILENIKLTDEQIEEGVITKEIFENKLKEYKEKQAEIEAKMRQYTDADKSFYITASLVLNLAKRAREIFECSETIEKRQILNFLLQNAELKGRNLQFTLKPPFDTIVKFNNCPKKGE
ncbi:MAG: zinc ribbon domain-containing protein [Candidatus Omnitrophica bacterium]|nr:zinc ribbon domain-containing protein [Candidatus Omnitrophota bacterium]